MMTDYKLAFAELFVRVFAGILFLFQGYDKLFHIKMPEVINTFMQDAEKRHIPRPVVAFISYLTSLIELLGGLCLILGLFTNIALYAIGIDLLLIGFAFSFMQPMWDMKHVFPRLILILILLILPPQANLFSLDNYINP